MGDAEFEIRRFNQETATNADFAAINAFDNRMKVESWPDDPPTPLAETRLQYRELPAYMEQLTWFVWRGKDEIVGQGGVSLMRTPENRHAAWGWIGVDPAWRRRGLASELLRLVVEAAKADGRRLLLGSTLSTAPAGDEFMHSLCATAAQATYTNQLNLEDLNVKAVQDWLALASKLENEFEMVLVEGRLPEDQLEAIAALMAVMNTAPRDGLDLEDRPPSVERLREMEAYAERGNWEYSMLYVRHRASGRLAGYTEVVWNRGEPYELRQGDTGVFPEFRNRGLGKWLKATMLEKVMRERPEVRFVRTGNAQSNAPMLRINTQLGFKPYLSRMNWQIEIERVEAWLALRPPTPGVSLAGA